MPTDGLGWRRSYEPLAGGGLAVVLLVWAGLPLVLAAGYSLLGVAVAYAIMLLLRLGGLE